VEEDINTSDLSISDLKSQIGTLSEQEIVKEVETGLSKVQKEYKSDVLGFGKLLHSQHKQEWNEGIKERWLDIFPEVEVKVEANITIKSSTLNQIPLKDYKENTNTND
jgi:hypothetical protein